jgi:fatty-acyl-CoA synthase
MAAGVELTPEIVSELQDMVRQAKGAVHSPKRITAVERLPLTGLGKLDKVALKAMASTS